MEDKPKRRGRPKKPLSEELERLETLLSNAPLHVKKLAAAEQSNLKQDFLKNEQIEKEIYKAYGVGPYVSKNLALEMESVGDESVNGFENKILDKFSEAQEALKDSRLMGASKTKENAKNRAYEIWGKNLDLYEKIANQEIKPDLAVKIILRAWETRGDGGPSPSINTIKKWLNLLKTDQRLTPK